MYQESVSQMPDIYGKIYTIYNCLIELGMEDLANDALKNRTKRIDSYVDIIRLHAVKQNRSDLTEQMQFGGLSY